MTETTSSDYELARARLMRNRKWGVLLVLDGWDAYYRRDVTEEDIQQEMRRMK